MSEVTRIYTLATLFGTPVELNAIQYKAVSSTFTKVVLLNFC